MANAHATLRCRPPRRTANEDKVPLNRANPPTSITDQSGGWARPSLPRDETLMTKNRSQKRRVRNAASAHGVNYTTAARDVRQVPIWVQDELEAQRLEQTQLAVTSSLIGRDPLLGATNKTPTADLLPMVLGTTNKTGARALSNIVALGYEWRGSVFPEEGQPSEGLLQALRGTLIAREREQRASLLLAGTKKHSPMSFWSPKALRRWEGIDHPNLLVLTGHVGGAGQTVLARAIATQAVERDPERSAVLIDASDDLAILRYLGIPTLAPIQTGRVLLPEELNAMRRAGSPKITFALALMPTPSRDASPESGELVAEAVSMLECVFNTVIVSAGITVWQGGETAAAVVKRHPNTRVASVSSGNPFAHDTMHIIDRLENVIGVPKGQAYHVAHGRSKASSEQRSTIAGSNLNELAAEILNQTTQD